MKGMHDEQSTDDSFTNVGPRIRALREQRNLSLRALAERCSLSTNAISLIERGESSPTVSTLHRLSVALGSRITDLFEQPDQGAVVFTHRNLRFSASASGVTMGSLGIGLKNQRIEPFLMTLYPGTGPDTPVVHPGQELVFCVSGTAEYAIGGKKYTLEPGDCLLFEAMLPHSFKCLGDDCTQLLLVFAADEGGDIARRRHLWGANANASPAQ
ncbi:MAG: helix-turn-helix domain-containing protein [Spirochaetota bacterium]